MKRKRLIWASVVIIALAALVAYDLLHERGTSEEFAIAEEFELKPLIELPTIGPFDLSVTKAVVYLWITAAILIVFSLLVRWSLKREPGRFRVLVEVLYGLAHDGIVGAVMKSGRATWFPFIAGAFFFVLTANLIGLIPLPLAEHHQFGFYTATANLYVTLSLALCTFVFTHYAGIRRNGGLHYFKNWAPPSAPPVLKQLIWVIHAVSEVFRLVSLAVRLFANMLAGHAILAVFFAMALIFQSYLAALVLQGASVLIYLFEIFVAFIQAFIFAILSAVYIAGALDQEH